MMDFLIFLGTMAGVFLLTALVAKFAPETLANGFMDYEKGKEIAPTVFTSKKTKKEKTK